MILNRLRIIYTNGFKQEKNLICNAYYEEVIRPTKNRIDEIEALGKKAIKKHQPELDRLNKIVDSVSPYCTTGSPLHEAMSTGFLNLIDTQGGLTPVFIEPIK